MIFTFSDGDDDSSCFAGLLWGLEWECIVRHTLHCPTPSRALKRLVTVIITNKKPEIQVPCSLQVMDTLIDGVLSHCFPMTCSLINSPLLPITNICHFYCYVFGNIKVIQNCRDHNNWIWWSKSPDKQFHISEKWARWLHDWFSNLSMSRMTWHACKMATSRAPHGAILMQKLGLGNQNLHSLLRWFSCKQSSKHTLKNSKNLPGFSSVGVSRTERKAFKNDPLYV